MKKICSIGLNFLLWCGIHNGEKVYLHFFRLFETARHTHRQAQWSFRSTRLKKIHNPAIDASVLPQIVEFLTQMQHVPFTLRQMKLFLFGFFPCHWLPTIFFSSLLSQHSENDCLSSLTQCGSETSFYQIEKRMLINVLLQTWPIAYQILLSSWTTQSLSLHMATALLLSFRKIFNLNDWRLLPRKHGTGTTFFSGMNRWLQAFT